MSARRRGRARALAAAGIAAVALAGMLAAGDARAVARRVPLDFATVQAAIDASASGDTVAIEPGVYAERLTLKSAVIVRASGGAGSVTVDAGGLGACASASSTQAGTRLEGVRLVGGAGASDGGVTIGGALRVNGGFLDVTDCAFESSSAQYGGGSAAQNANVTFTRCRWVDLGATFGGGHFQAGGSAHWTDATWDDVGATRGGACYATLGAQLTVFGAVVERAIVGADGGAFHVDAGVATLSDVLCDGARAQGRGGAIFVAAGGQVIVSHCAFLDCESGLGGGAFFVSCTPTAPGSIGAAADCALLDLTNVDVLGSRGPAPAVGGVTDAGALRMRSSVVAGNASGLACLDSRAHLDVSCSLLYENGGADLSGPCAPAIDPANRNEDPRLCDLAGRDLHACSNSPLLSPGCGDPYWGSEGEGCSTCGPTPAARATWGALKARYHR